MLKERLRTARKRSFGQGNVSHVHRGVCASGSGGCTPPDTHTPLDTPQTPPPVNNRAVHSLLEWILETTRKHAPIFHRTSTVIFFDRVLFEKQKISFLSTKVDRTPHANSGSPYLHSVPSIFQQYGWVDFSVGEWISQVTRWSSLGIVQIP